MASRLPHCLSAVVAGRASTGRYAGVVVHCPQEAGGAVVTSSAISQGRNVGHRFTHNSGIQHCGVAGMGMATRAAGCYAGVAHSPGCKAT